MQATDHLLKQLPAWQVKEQTPLQQSQLGIARYNREDEPAN